MFINAGINILFLVSMFWEELYIRFNKQLLNVSIFA